VEGIRAKKKLAGEGFGEGEHGFNCKGISQPYRKKGNGRVAPGLITKKGRSFFTYLGRNDLSSVLMSGKEEKISIDRSSALKKEKKKEQAQGKKKKKGGWSR